MFYEIELFKNSKQIKKFILKSKILCKNFNYKTIFQKNLLPTVWVKKQKNKKNEAPWKTFKHLNSRKCPDCKKVL